MFLFRPSGTIGFRVCFQGTPEPIMATLGGSRGDRLGNSNNPKSLFASPEKVRELLNDGVSSPNGQRDRCLCDQSCTTSGTSPLAG